MAAAAPSPLASSVEKTNGAKLSRLLIDGGTTVLRTIFDHYHPPANLLADLHANYHSLNNLLRRRVLHRPQWDLLFPPGGATPDSNTFDITLLFLLLTNICGLSPPPTGWHACPPPSDTSLEANLARIKFFRNELYGHVTTTGVDTPTFSALWLEISAVLVALGLNKAEIDRLKAERCGEEDYIDVLLEWADSEEDIKSQLKDVRQSQTKVQQTVDEVHKTQLENHEILQDSYLKLVELHQVQAKTKQTVDEVRQTQLEHQEVHESLTRTQQAVSEVRQTQIEDRCKIEEILQIEKTTQHLVTESSRSRREESKAIQDTKSKVEEVSECLESLKQTFEQKVKGQRDNREDEILKKLAKIDMVKDVRRHTESYVDGTRLSIFAKVENWLNDKSSPNRVMVICGNPGMGKSVISAVTCQRMLQAGRLAGSHFCQHDRARHRNPKVMLQSLASHLADSLPDYKKTLVEKLSRNLGVQINDMEVKDLFELLFEEPLSSLNDPGLAYLIIIDGIDESEYQGRNELLDMIAEYFKKLPSWIRFLVTTRPEINIAERLKCLQPVQLEANSGENLRDICLCFEEQLHHVLPSENQNIILEALVQKSEGVILYAHFLIDLIRKLEVTLTPELLDSTLPSGISSVYHSYFTRLETDLSEELKVPEDQFMSFLSAVVAAREPLPLGFVSKLLLPSARKSPSAVKRKVKEAIACVSALLPVQDERIHFFHKSVKDWLSEHSKYGQHHFNVDEKEGHHVLSKLCIDELNDVKRKSVDGAQFSDTIKYALQHGVQHMLQLDEDTKVCSFEEVVQNYVLNLEIVYAKLCVNVTAASEDILCFQKQDVMKVLFKEYQSVLDTLLYLLRKHLSTLTELPHAIFQILLNEGGPEVSSKAFHLLETKYCDLPYMEYLHKKDLQGLAQSRFQCSAEVACFDVSPTLDYMVCECRDETIQLWSLHTGKLLWTRPVIVEKLFGDWNTAYRRDPSCVGLSYSELIRDPVPTSVYLFYRSVVFHPTEELVFPGILSHAYSFDGVLKPLFPSSNCRFSVCSMSGNKDAMLTDSTDDAKSIIMWSLTNGSEIAHFTGNEDILSFAWSCDGRLLAISFCTGTISLVDVVDGFKPLAQTTTSKVCGMIKVSPDCRFLFCWHFPSRGNDHYLFRINVEMKDSCNFSLDVSLDKVSYEPWEFEACGETGFLLGDPICCLFNDDSGLLRYREGAFAVVVNKQTVLRGFPGSNFINMLYVENLKKDREVSKCIAKSILFSVNGETVYVVNRGPEIMAWDVSSGELKATKRTGSYDCVVAVREGVVLQAAEIRSTLELWNYELSECILKWTDLKDIRRVYSISERLVACVQMGVKVIILDTSNGNIVSTIQTFHGEFVACNSSCQLITIMYHSPYSMQLWDGGNVLWERSWYSRSLYFFSLPGMFSPVEQFVVIPGELPCVHRNKQGLFVIDATSGRTLHLLCEGNNIFDCRFVSDEECVVNSYDVSRGFCLRLFNIESGDLLTVITMENKVFCLAACPRKCLIAIGLMSSRPNFKVIKVNLQRSIKYDSKCKKVSNKIILFCINALVRIFVLRRPAI